MLVVSIEVALQFKKEGPCYTIHMGRANENMTWII